MTPIDILRGASSRVYNVAGGLAGTPDAGGDLGIGAGGDTTHNIDATAENAVLSHLRENSFGCTVLGEECGRVEIPGPPGGSVIMDAVDGSVNSVRGVPFFCCSLAYAAGKTLGSVTDAVVTDLSGGGQYWASRGRGAFLDDRPLRTGSSLGAGYRIITLNISGADAAAASRLQPVMAANHTRHFGANALEMAYVARGWLDALVDVRGRIRVQDVAAGCLLVREAGGLVLDEEGADLDSDLGYDTRLSFVAASGRKVADELAAQMNG